ncbi:N-acetylmuramoyl-L-alanine amidase [Streptomyces filamentosus]|uniref:N-acetylmuramoyl-L-alanine amidase n=1 Tax=Streptomyces filamentosus TaxID=67294 RepID=UPI00123AB675|nr:N-acetylmuramoyl-L-alanine amidase [Streptomyces filamentosus]KAA6217388.1 N-acetylmuramoyl-L-alanine amidase [Streptomyces filamentosus]
MPYDHRNPVPRSVPAALAALVCSAALAGCGGASGAAQGSGGPAAGTTAPAPPSASASGSAPASAPASGSGAAATAGTSGQDRTRAATAADRSLAGRTVVVDPGHNPGNFRHGREIAAKVDIGTARKECDTTGTSTNATGGRAAYTEAAFTLDVSHRLRKLLEARGAEVVLTHDADRPYGPCIDERARIGNAAEADAVVSVHADGSAAGNRGFHVIVPAKVRGGSADTGPIVAPSRALGEDVVTAFRRTTGTSPANYLGGGTGLDVRSDLGGLNLSTVPKVFVECGNMRDPKDAALLTSGVWRQKAAQGLADGIVTYLEG